MLNLYAETTFEVKPPTPTSRFEFQIPNVNGIYEKSKFSTRSKRSDRQAKDEATYNEHYLASASSFYFRQNKTYPRTFLWRVIDGQTVLEIQCADLSRSENDIREAYYTLAFEFQDQIAPQGVAIADSPHSDELYIFVLTTGNEVFNLRLPTDYFRNPNVISHEVGIWCKPVVASALAIDTAYQIHAPNMFEIYVSFISGKIERWSRKMSEERWTQTNYDDKSWGSSFFSIVSRRGQQDIEYGRLRLAHNTAHAMVSSPDTKYLYTLCLNHTLRVWDVVAGRLVETRDLLDVAREPQEKIQLNPSEPGFIRLVKPTNGKDHVLVTYSPHEGGQIKFWTVRAGVTEYTPLEDRYPNAKLHLPDPDPTGNTLWSLTGLELIPGNELKPSQLWVLWRNHNHHQVYTLHFRLPSLRDDWQDKWVTSSPKLHRLPVPDLIISDTQDVTSKWLEYLFFPGVYSSAILETALTRYQELTGAKLSLLQKNGLLKERLCSLVAAGVTLRRYQESNMDYDRFISDTDHQWRNYWRIAESMNEGRFAPLGLACDTFVDMTWITMADSCCALRECSDVEILLTNNSDDLKHYQEIASDRWLHRKIDKHEGWADKMSCLLRATEKFVKTFSPELNCDFMRTIEEDIYMDSEMTMPERIVIIFNQLDFANAVSDEAEQEFIRNLAPLGGLDGVRTTLINNVIYMLERTTFNKVGHPLLKTLFGRLVASKALLDDIVLSRQILLNLLVLSIFIDESKDFDPAELFSKVLRLLQSQERHLWLATHSRTVPLEIEGISSNSIGRKVTQTAENNDYAVSLLEETFTKHVRPHPAVETPQHYLVTYHNSDCQAFLSGKEFDSEEYAAVHILCDLIAHRDIHLATDFLRFISSSAMSTYAKGRLRLARADYAEAAIYFREASYTLACGKALGDLQGMSAGLLSILDAEYFNNGLPRYFQHIMGLFDADHAYVETAAFAKLALQTLPVAQIEPPPNFVQEILARLFTAELKRSKFESAYAALIQFSDKALQRSSATALVNAILDPKTSTTSGSGVLSTLQKLPWSLHPHLASHIDSHLASLARKQVYVPGLGGQWNSDASIDYLSILHAVRLARNDYRGSVAVLFDRLRIIQRSGRAKNDPQATALRHALLALINVMTCVAPDDAYIVTDIDDDPRAQNLKRTREPNPSESVSRKRRKRVITLDDLRRDYQQVLDRCSRIERGDFSFDLDGDSDEDEMEVDGSSG